MWTPSDGSRGGGAAIRPQSSRPTAVGAVGGGGGGPSFADPVVVFDRQQGAPNPGGQPTSSGPGGGGLSNIHHLDVGPASAKANVLALPADLTLDMEPRRGSGFTGHQAVHQSVPPAPVRPLSSGPLAYSPANNNSSNNSVPAVAAAPAPSGIAAMWGDQGAQAAPGPKAGGQGTVPVAPGSSWSSAAFPSQIVVPPIATSGSGISQGGGVREGGVGVVVTPTQSTGGMFAVGPFGSFGGANWSPQPFLPSNKAPDWSVPAGLVTGINTPGQQQQQQQALGGLAMSAAAAAAFAAPGGVRADTPGSGAGYASLQGPALPNFAGASVPNFANGPSGQPARPMHPKSSSGGPFGLTSQQQQQQQVHYNHHPQQHAGGAPKGGGPIHTPQQRVIPASAAVANLPDDIFDSKPPPGPPAQKPAQPSVAKGPPGGGPPVAGERPSAGGGRGRSGGRGRGGGRGGSLTPSAPVGEEDASQGRSGGVAQQRPESSGGGSNSREGPGPGRGFAGRNGRGAGRSLVHSAATSVPAGGAVTQPPTAQVPSQQQTADVGQSPALAYEAGGRGGGRSGGRVGGRGSGGGGRGGRGGNEGGGRGGGKQSAAKAASPAPARGEVPPAASSTEAA